MIRDAFRRFKHRRRLARAMAEVMAHCNGFFATDLFLYWRARELAKRGEILISDVAGVGYSKAQVRRPLG